MLLFLGVWIFGSLPARGGGVQVDSTSVGRAGGFSAPFWVMMRSAALPGWGQLQNGKWFKAILLGGTECGFLYGIYNEDRLADDAGRKTRQYPEDSSEGIYWKSESDRHRATKKDYLWWGAFTLMLSLGDAYVDAHLQRFDVEFREEDSAIRLSFEAYP